MRRLAHAHEHLDGRLSDTPVLAGNLRDLARINRLLGGTALSLRAVRGLLAMATGGDAPLPAHLRLLDVGTGAADIPLAILAARGPWATVHVTAVDSRPEILAAARANMRGLVAERADLRLQVADGLALPFPDGAFDVAHASLVLHHLEPPDAIRMLAELCRVSKLGIVVNDLARSRLGWLGGWILLHLMTRNRFTLRDGPLSVRRAYTLGEARTLLRRAGLRPVVEVRGFVGHRWAIGAVPVEAGRE